MLDGRLDDPDRGKDTGMGYGCAKNILLVDTWTFGMGYGPNFPHGTNPGYDSVSALGPSAGYLGRNFLNPEGAVKWLPVEKDGFDPVNGWKQPFRD